MSRSRQLLRLLGQRLTHSPYLLLTITSILWATNLILAKFIVGHVPPVAFSIFRWGGACLIILPFAWPHLKQDWPAIRADLPLIVLLAVTGYAANSMIAYYGMQFTTALNALLIQSGGPFFVAIWALLLFRMTMSAAQIVGIVISLTGVLIIILHGDFTQLGTITFNKGDILVVIALLTFGLYSALVGRRRKMHQLSFLAVVAGLAAILLSPFGVIEAAGGARVKPDFFTFATSLYGALFVSALAILTFNRGVELVGPNRAAPFFHLVPVFGSVMAIVFLGEELMLYHLVGYPLVLAGVLIASRF